MEAWFISDIHLKSLNERNGNILLRFLHSLKDGKTPATHLFLLGDIFDFWVGDHDYYLKKYGALVDILIRLKAQGLKIVYVEGNHDFHVKEFWQSLGFEAFVEDRYFDLDPWKVRISHGDLMNPSDFNYIKYRGFVRQSYMEKLAHLLPAKQLNQLGEWASQTSRKFSSVKRQETEHQLVQMIHDYAKTCFKQMPFDFIISGHMHFRDEWTYSEGARKVTSINLGSWYDQPIVLNLNQSGYRWLNLAKVQ